MFGTTKFNHEDPMPAPPESSHSEPEYYFKEKYVVMGKDGRGTIVKNAIGNKVENGLLTFYIEDHEKPKSMINEYNIVLRPQPKVVFNLSEIRYYKTLECDLGINDLEDKDE